MMKYLFTVVLIINNLFAHGISSEHTHIFSSLHIVDFSLIIIGSVVFIYIVNFYKNRNSDV